LDVLGGARYWNPDLNLSVNLKGNLNVDVTAEATFDLRDVLRTVRNRGFHLNRRGAKLLEREAAARSAPGQDITFERTVQIEVEKAVALAASNAWSGLIRSSASDCATPWVRRKSSAWKATASVPAATSRGKL
jgi:hypothetical protein